MISVDTKKRELVGDFKIAGREWQLKGEPEPVRVHDFEIREPEKGKVAPYGVYHLGRNVGWVSVGVWIMIRPHLQWKASAAGGGEWATRTTRKPSGS